MTTRATDGRAQPGPARAAPETGSGRPMPYHHGPTQTSTPRTAADPELVRKWSRTTLDPKEQ
ncbi:hypothetical protein GCM10022224_056130 [Nonomuraea antimicrobica]|uniref:Uncharacterized protein n=1 Tax=Nonomuraea antimicrobica TaxID=561173 RepID=A0ABP7CC14_9ACTN